MNYSTVKLGDIAKIFNGKTPAESEQRQSGFPVLKIRDVDENGVFRGRFDSFVDQELAEKFSEKQICANDVMILNAAHNADYVASKMFFANEQVAGALSTGEWLIIRTNVEDADPRFIHFWLQEARTKYSLRLLVKGIHLYPKDVAELNIPLPQLSEQRRIASLLVRADRLRQLQNTAQNLEKTLIQSVFLEMFGDPITNSMGWDVETIQDVVNNHDSKRVPLEESVRAKRQGEYPYYGATGIIDYINDYIFDQDMLLIAEDGKNLLNRTKPIAFMATGKYWVNNHSHIVSSAGRVNLRYLETALNIRDISSYVTGIDQFKLNRANLDIIPVQIPPLNLQEEFAGVVARVESLRGRMSEAGRQVDGLFESLLAEAFV